ncbi:flavo protein [Lepidopterella palustris CBS 459.81]|uniref:Flavo protein n=1 Tax=Lepidopterella palustris CBS 459.81 TaxID=1314670 RepID=A0A8E2DWH0_9PEZI|nr:flavo protein [Lepidopterella palustris CBS 459.81]
MAQLEALGIVVLAAVLVGTVAYFTKGVYWAVPGDPKGNTLAQSNGAAKPGKSRNFIEKMRQSEKNCVVFYGSQTGTAEGFAGKLAEEGHLRFGLNTMVADLEDYDYDNLDQFPEDKLAIFVLATYGEGEPTDNAVQFYNLISADDVTFSKGVSAAEKPLSNLKYVIFGLGNNTYEHYNFMVRSVNKHLTKLGATRIGTAGEGDDGASRMEEDFLAWKELMWADVCEKMGWEEREAINDKSGDLGSGDSGGEHDANG